MTPCSTSTREQSLAPIGRSAPAARYLAYLRQPRPRNVMPIGNTMAFMRLVVSGRETIR
jgi:hypothetical protein